VNSEIDKEAEPINKGENNINMEDSAFSFDSNSIHRNVTTIRGPSSDSFQVHKVLAGGSANSSAEAAPLQIAVAGDYTKIDFRNILAHLEGNY
jgi:hypothetical protein